jgi:regulator of nucleoside diphosphate kinase
MTNKENVLLTERARPKITLSTDDYERLSALANAAKSRMPYLADELSNEIERAHVLAKGRLPQDVVCMNSEVEYRDDTTGKIQKIMLVYPADANISKKRVSVLTPIGTALIGLRSGHSIIWQTPSGEMRQLTVLSVQDRVPVR